MCVIYTSKGMSKKFGVRVIYRKIRNVRYLYIKRNVKKVWGARYTLGARYLSKHTVPLKTFKKKKQTIFIVRSYFPKQCVLLKLLDERNAQISINTNYNLQRPVQMFVYCL